MPVRSAKWLTGVTAAMGLSLAGTGCQTLPISCGGCGNGAMVATGASASLAPSVLSYSHSAGPTPASGDLTANLQPPVVATWTPTPVTPSYSPAVYPPAHATLPASSVVTMQRPQRRPLFGSPVATPSAAPAGSVPGTLNKAGNSLALPALSTTVDAKQGYPTSSAGQSSWTPVQRVVAPGNEAGEQTQLVAMNRPQVTPNWGSMSSPAVRYAAPPARERDLLPKPKTKPGLEQLPPVAVTHPVEAPREFEKRTLSAYIIEPPDVLQIEGTPDLINPDKSVQLTGPALVAGDGSISLATLGRVYVAGKTIDEAKLEIAQVIQRRQPDVKLEEILSKLKVDVAAFNSKFFYVISDGAGYGEQVIKVPITGNETVLDAIAAIQGIPAVGSKKRIWLARATPAHAEPQILPIDWQGIAMDGRSVTNYQIFPGDRLYIQSDRLLNLNSAIGKVLAPVERILGVTLLGASTVQTIRQGTPFGGNPGIR
jgi:polysaccharide export outer membrane protein